MRLPSTLLLLLWLLALASAPVTAQEAGAGQNEPEAAAQSPASIPVDSSAATDAAIAARLRQIYTNLPSLEGVQVSVAAGVVTLRGNLPTQAARQQAQRLAGQVEGVAAVESQLTGISDIPTRLDLAGERLAQGARALLAWLPLLLVALLVVLAFWLLGSLLLRWEGLFQRLAPNEFLRDLLRQLARLLLFVVGLYLALELLDATAVLGALIGAAGLFGLAMSFALRDTVENYIASILLSVRQPFAPNDHIRLDQHEGLVLRLTSRATILMTFDGNHIRIPNATVFKGILTNFSHNPQRRFGFELGIGTATDLPAARALAVRTLQDTSGVLAAPPALCVVQQLGDSNVVLELYGWTDQRRFDFTKVRSAAIEAVKRAFDAAGYDMPEPIYRLRVQGLEGTGLTAHADAPAPLVPAPQAAGPDGPAPDVERDHALEHRIAREADQENDLLRPDAPRE